MSVPASARPRPGPAASRWPQGRHAAPLPARLRSLLLYALVVAGGVVFALPFLRMLSTSLIGQAGARWLPHSIELSSYLEPWRTLPFARFYPSTALITLLAIGDALRSSSLAAFAFSRMAFPGRHVRFVLVLATTMVPEQVALIPTDLLWSKLGLITAV